MRDFYDNLENRTATVRESEQMAALAAQVEHAQKNTQVYAKNPPRC